MTFNEAWADGPDGVACSPGGTPPPAVAEYQHPLIGNAVDSGDINALIGSWTQDSTPGSPTFGKHTISVNPGVTAVGSHPNQHGFHVIPLTDVHGAAVGAGEFHSFTSYIELISGLTNTADRAVLYAGIVNGPSMNNDNAWHRFSAFFGGSPRLLRSGRDGTIAAALPPGSGSVHTRMDLLTRGGPTAGTLRVLETTCKGYDAAKLPIASSESGIAGITQDMLLVPHIFIAAGAYTAPSPVSLEFYVRTQAYRLPGGAFP